MIDCSVDTSALIDLLRHDPAVNIALSGFSNFCISHVALGELLLGAKKSGNPTERSRLFSLIDGMVLLQGDDRTSFIYAAIRADLEKSGSMIPQNDLWIAAAAIQAGVPLLTRDAHFLRIPQLRVLTY